MPKQSWFTMAKRGEDSAEIAIYSDIGGFGVTAADFKAQLDALGNVGILQIRISSDGGDVFHGFNIYNMLIRHAAWKVVTIDGLAASMASVIAMAGDEVVMPSNAMLMIHNPWGGVIGESEQIISFGEALAKMRDGIADAYQDRSFLTRAEILKMMDKETWLSAKQAKEYGFADRVERASKMSARATFNLSRFTHVPASFGRILKEHSMANKAKVKSQTADDADDFDNDEIKSAEEIRAEERQALLVYAEEVRALCRLAGMPELADQFIRDDKPLGEVIKALDEARAKPDKSTNKGGGKRDDNEISARHKPEAAEPKQLDPTVIYARWNSTGRAA